jgi:hypothetical protein
MKIPLSELKFSSISVSDFGRVFWWGDRLFRGIPASHISDVQNLFDSGLMKAIMEKGLFVKSWVSPMEVEGYGLIIEHEVINVPVYPKEWTFSMLQDAALLVLDLNEVALQFGYQTADCHGYNVLFANSRPVYVDLGSFKKVTTSDGVLSAYHDFMRSYYYPLKIWSVGGEYLGLRVVPRIGCLIPSEAYFKFRWPIFRCFKDSILAKSILVLNVIRTIQHRNTSKLLGRCPTWLIPLLLRLATNNIFSGPAKIQRLRKVVKKIKPLTSESNWSNYHNGLSQAGKITSTPRFDYIADKISSLGVNSVVEIAGNQGVFSRILSDKKFLQTIICTDGDGNALDKGYCFARNNQINIDWAILNPFTFENAHVEVSVEKRFQAEAVIALALTHHLILTQNFRLGHILDVIGKFAKLYVFIEFMPLGLHNGKTAPPIPDWYNETWFEAEFTQRFELVDKKHLEENRVLFIGKIM